MRKENRSQEGKVKFNFAKRKKGKREPTLSAIKKEKIATVPMRYFTSDYFKNANKELRTKETYLLTWNELIKSKQQIELCIKNLPSVPICTCSNNNNNVLLFCYVCKYW